MSALDDIRQRVEAATPGPWGVGARFGTIYGYVEGSAPTLLFEPHPNHIIPATGRPSEDCLADGEFIAFARGDIPRLLAAVDAVLALHSKRVTQAVFGDCAAEACDHEDTCPTEPFEVCTACWNAAENMDSYFMEGQISSVAYPCPTIRAVNDALEAGK